MDKNKQIDITQRLLSLQRAVRDGKIHFRPQDENNVREFMDVTLRPGELLDPMRLSEETMGLVKTSSMALRFLADEHISKSTTELNLSDGQSELFRLFEELFVVLTGYASAKINSDTNLKDTILRQANDDANFRQKFNSAIEKLVKFYSQYAMTLFKHAKEIGGLKVVLGGQRTFGPSALGGVRKMGLYVDTQLIPDPIYPFLEAELHLKARYVQLILNLHKILQLKPLVDARLPVPPIVVFPSFEKGLEEKDVHTQVGINSLLLQVVGNASQTTFSEIDELIGYVSERESEFISSMMAADLFIPIGALPGQRLSTKEAIDLHLAGLRESRSADNIQMMEALRPGNFVMISVMERLSPLYHLLENSDEMIAQPMLTQEVHWHFFEKIALSSAQTLFRENVISEDSFKTVRALQSEGLAWLSNIPIPVLTELLKNQENLTFREELYKHTSILSAAGESDIDRAVREVTHGIESLIQKHQKTIKEIEAKYAPSYASVFGVGGAGTLLGAAAQFIPSLGFLELAAPAVAATVMATDYTKDKIKEVVEKRQARRSMLGVLAATPRN